MRPLTSYIAILLLLLFTRAMVPDALILELHHHTHTVHTNHSDTHDAQIGQKHKHCPVEDVFEAPFQGTYTSIDFTPATHHTAYNSCYQSGWFNSGNSLFHLRGPPVV